MRTGSIVLIIWLVIGVIAATQRDYFNDSDKDCNQVGDTVLTVVAGPLNYIGVNPKVDCKVPQPSQ